MKIFPKTLPSTTRQAAKTSSAMASRQPVAALALGVLIALAFTPWPATLLASTANSGRDARVAKQVVAVVNELDAAKRLELLNDLLGESERNQHMATGLGFIAGRHGRVRVEETAESGPTWAKVVLRGEEEDDFLTLELEYESPDGDGLQSLGIRFGRPQAQTGPALDAVKRREIIESIAGLLRAEYAIASERNRLGDAVGDWDDSLFADATSATRFASRLTTELRRLQDDKHLAVLDPARSEGRFESPDEPVDAQHGHDVPDRGFSRVEVLDDNVGYIQMSAFDGSVAGIERVREIMASLDSIEALVIDLRGCRGGEPGMVLELSSFFFAEPTHLATSISPWAEGPQERWTTVPQNDHFASLPVLVLTDRMTASAAESFVFGLKRHDRITTIGETTAGAGHLADVRRLPGGFGFQLPVGRTYDPETGLGWEGAGIEPDVTTETADALEVALARIR